MASVLKVAILSLISIYGVFSLPLQNSDVGLNTVQMIENHGYVCETHHVTTEDGYILTLHRIPHGIDNHNDEKKPVVFLMHGLISSSADYVNMGPKRSLGYILADAGYDVWMGNARGNAWSRNHTTLDVKLDMEKFFDFSWHEIGYYDLAASIDYILDLKGDDSLYYIGHSQGTTSFMVLMSTKPEYNAKIKIASLMAPASFMAHRSFGLVTDLGKHIDQVEVLLKRYKIYELPLTERIREWAMNNCGKPEAVPICIAIFSAAGGGTDESQMDVEMLPVIGTNAPSNAGMKQFVHYGQQIRSGGFAMFDYGAEKNLELYGSETPPPYDFSKITAPVAVYYAQNDGLVPVEDAKTVISKLPNLANDYLVPYESFNHIDFIFGKDVIELLYNEMLRVMKNY